MFRTYRNFHNTQQEAESMAACERRDGGVFGGWWREATKEEEASALHQAAISQHNGAVMESLADSAAEFYGGRD